jgi:peptidyl-prolyl cis-trans isomerase SurA
MMKTMVIILVWIALSGQLASALTVDSVLAIVNNEIITLSDYTRFLFKMGTEEKARFDPEIKGIDKNILQKMIEEKIIIQEAQKKGIDATEDEIDATLIELREETRISDHEFSNILIEEGITINDYKKLIKENIIALKLIDLEISSRIIVTDKDISEYYKANIMLFLRSPEKKMVHAIFMGIRDNMTVTEITDLKIRAMKIYEEITDGESFEKMVNLYSDEPLKSRNGFLGEFKRGGLIPALEKKLSDLREGEVSRPIWTKEGVYLLKLTETSKEKYAELEEVREVILNKLIERKSKEKFNEWMKTLWERSSVEIKI